jgi:hypothetical protein
MLLQMQLEMTRVAHQPKSNVEGVMKQLMLLLLVQLAMEAMA